jgi:predicted RNase H-like nuclease (RuvC/YqgF family)
MARKRLGDLLRQEAEKSPNSESQPVIEVTAEELLEDDTKTVEELPINTSNKSSANDTSPTKAELEATVAELKAALEQGHQLELAHQHEGSLQQQVNELQAELSEEKKLVQKLQKELEKANSFKAELDQAKKTALQLAQENSKLIEEINALKNHQGSVPLKSLKEDVPVKSQKEEIKPQAYPQRGRYIVSVAEHQTGESSDFASKSWLLD